MKRNTFIFYLKKIKQFLMRNWVSYFDIHTSQDSDDALTSFVYA